MKKLIAVALGICTLLGLTGCNENAAGTPSVNSSRILLNSFETQRDLDTMRMFGMLGVASINSDIDYVKEGKSSLKITLESNPFKEGAPYLYQSTNLTAKELDYSEFSSVGYITFDIYNAQTTARTLGLQLVYGDGSMGMQQWMELKAGWSSVRYAVARQYIPTSKGSGEIEQRLVSGVNFHFKRANASDPNEDYYLDNIQLHKTQTAVEQINMSLQPNEILSFDKKWQVGMLTFGNWMAQGMLPNLSTEYLENEPERGGVLKITQPVGYEDASSSGHYMGFEVSKKLLEMIDWATYDENAMLCFDVYCPAENGIKSINLELQDDVGRKYFKHDYNLTPGVWNEIKISVKDLNKGRAEEENSANRFAYTGAFLLTYGEEVAPERTLYIDAIRMEIR